MHRIITAHSPVRDTWRVLHPESSLGSAEDDLERARRRPVPTVQFNVEENGVTSNSVYNTWRWPKSQQKKLGPGRESSWPEIPSDTLDLKGKRLDYIFASSGLTEDERSSRGWVVHDVRVGMMDRHPELGCTLSDHFSVEATLVLHQADHKPASAASNVNRHRSRSRNRSRSYSRSSILHPTAAASLAETRGTKIPDSHLENGVYLQSPSNSETHLSLPVSRPRDPNAPPSSSFSAQLRAAAQPVSFMPAGVYDEILAEIHAYMARECFQRRWRSTHFGTWVIVTMICYIGVWWTPRWVSFILMVLSSLGLAGGVIDGLIALLFVGSEMGALKEFEWEIMNAKATATGASGAGFEEATPGSSREGSRDKKQ